MRTCAAFLLMSVLVAGQTPREAADFLREGHTLVEARKFAEAQELYEKAALSFPTNPDLYFELGMVYFRQHNWAKAIESYQSSLNARPKQIKALFYLAESYFAESDMDQARETMAQAASIAPNDAQVCQKYGEYLTATLDTRKTGVTWLQKAQTLNPKLAHIDFEIGKAQFQLTDFPSAIGNFESALKKDPSDGDAAFFLAESWASLGEWEKARDYYSYSLQHGHADGLTYHGLGKAQVQLGDVAIAVDSLQHALKLQPSLVQAHFQLSKAYRELGRIEESRHEAKLFEAISNRIDTSRGLNGADEQNAWRHVKPLLDAGNELEALEHLAKLPNADSMGGAYPYYLLGIMYNSMGRQEDAKRVLATAKAHSPQDADITAYFGMVQLSSGDAATAEQNFEEALQINPGEGLALIGMGSLEYQQQRWAHAVEYLEKSRTVDPGVLYMLCDAYFRVGKTNEAMLTAQVIQALGADQKALLEAVDKLVKLHQAHQPPLAP